MTAKFHREPDVDAALIRERVVAIVGMGNQGRAHALNLRDSGVSVIIGARAGGRSASEAAALGFEVLSIRDAAQRANVVMLLSPDETHREIFETDIAPGLEDSDVLGFAHGFSVHYGEVRPPESIDVVLVAPTGPGRLLRSQFEAGGGIPALVAVHRDASGRAQATALSYAAAIGSGRAAIIETTFEEECETDLFGEQVVVCGGLTRLIQGAFETLTEAGYAPEVAYFECLHQVVLLADMIQRRGIAGMRAGISNTAKYGDLTRGPRIIDAHVKENMAAVLDDVRSGRFAREWIAESNAGRPELDRLEREAAAHPLEDVGGRLRPLMPWLDDS